MFHKKKIALAGEGSIFNDIVDEAFPNVLRPPICRSGSRHPLSIIRFYAWTADRPVEPSRFVRPGDNV